VAFSTQAQAQAQAKLRYIENSAREKSKKMAKGANWTGTPHTTPAATATKTIHEKKATAAPPTPEKKNTPKKQIK